MASIGACYACVHCMSQFRTDTEDRDTIGGQGEQEMLEPVLPEYGVERVGSGFMLSVCVFI